MARAKDPASKSQLIRDYFKKHPKASAREVREALAKDGVEVSTVLIYNVSSRKRRRRKAAQVQPTIGQGNGRSNGDSISVGALLEARKLVSTLGSINEAKRALDTLAKLT